MASSVDHTACVATTSTASPRALRRRRRRNVRCTERGKRRSKFDRLRGSQPRHPSREGLPRHLLEARELRILLGWADEADRAEAGRDELLQRAPKRRAGAEPAPIETGDMERHEALLHAAFSGPVLAWKSRPFVVCATRPLRTRNAPKRSPSSRSAA